MQFGMIGLGRMGASMVQRLLRGGHACVVHDVQPFAVAALVDDGASGTASQTELVAQLDRPRTVWLMLPAGAVDQALGDLLPLLDPGDIVVDGGNSHHHDDMRRGLQLQARGIHYLDSVIGSWLLDLTAAALLKDPALAAYSGRVSDSGEGRWTIQAAIDEGVPVPVLSAALFERFASRGNADFANRVVSAMRHEFGGHAEKAAS